MNYIDFKGTESLAGFEMVPADTATKVKIHIVPGNYYDESKGWTDGYATRNDTTGSVYLSCEFTIVDGKYSGRKIRQPIGLYSDKKDNIWGEMGKSFIRNMLSSAKGFTNKDESLQAAEDGKIDSFAELEGLEFAVLIDIKPDRFGHNRNVIKKILTPQYKKYREAMGHTETAGQIEQDEKYTDNTW